MHGNLGNVTTAPPKTPDPELRQHAHGTVPGTIVVPVPPCRSSGTVHKYVYSVLFLSDVYFIGQSFKHHTEIDIGQDRCASKRPHDWMWHVYVGRWERMNIIL
jgi:hypothetical protein